MSATNTTAEDSVKPGFKSKAAFIRAQDTELEASAVVLLGKKAKLRFDEQYVYEVRSQERKRHAAPTPQATTPQAASSLSVSVEHPRPVGDGELHMLVRLVLKHGAPGAKALIDEAVKRVDDALAVTR